MMIDEYPVRIAGRVVKRASLENEWLNWLPEPGRFIDKLARAGSGADYFTFRQKVGETEPRFSYPMEWESLAVIPVAGYENWLHHQINNGAKRAIKKAAGKGVEVRVVSLDEEFVAGVTGIINETPVRQGRPYMHYGKSAEDMKAEFSREKGRCTMIGAYLQGELIGFIQLGHGEGWVVPFGMVSMIRHRDKSPQNALLAKAVEFCAEKGIRYLLYGTWSVGGLGEFKRNNGCVEMKVPRYYVPLSMAGRIACRFKLYRGVSGILPVGMLEHAQGLRKRWYSLKFGMVKE